MNLILCSLLVAFLIESLIINRIKIEEGGNQMSGELHISTNSKTDQYVSSVSMQKRKTIICIINISLAKCPNLEIDGLTWPPGVITLAFLTATTGGINLYFFDSS